jgi:hypothetical protein
MFGKTQLGILESFQPYESLQMELGQWTGQYIHPLLPWLLSYLNGSTAAGFAFANLYQHLPGGSGPTKGFIAGVLGWLAMDLIFFSVTRNGPICDATWSRPVASAFFSRDDIGLQHHHGARLQQDR